MQIAMNKFNKGAEDFAAADTKRQPKGATGTDTKPQSGSEGIDNILTVN
jgi:hypothetical protein